MASRIIHPHDAEDKTSRFMVKKLFTARNADRDSKSYIEKKEEGDISD